MVGVDEVGRGCWAGPLLVVAARLVGLPVNGLTDSKLLSRQQRQSVYQLLIINYRFGEGWVSALEIDEQGLTNALRLGVARALAALKVLAAEEVLMDGKVNYIDQQRFQKTSCAVGADLHVPIVSAASIYAKVMRDDFMRRLASSYPQYGFENHVGYGTKAHREALQKLGIIEGIHRRSFAPIQALIQ